MDRERERHGGGEYKWRQPKVQTIRALKPAYVDITRRVAAAGPIDCGLVLLRGIDVQAAIHLPIKVEEMASAPVELAR
jgi:hypothetical protein